jgi:hypothetical protein
MALGLAIPARERDVASVDAPREQSHALIPGPPPSELRAGERAEVAGGQQLRSDVGAVVRGVGGVVSRRAVVVDEANKPGVFHAVGLGRAER